MIACADGDRLDFTRRVCVAIGFAIAVLALAAAPSVARAQVYLTPPSDKEIFREHITQPFPEAEAPFIPPLTDLPPDTQWNGRVIHREPIVEAEEPWTHQILPDGLMYRAYLAGAKESRFASRWHHEKDTGWIWDIALGGRAAIWRYGTTDGYRPEGWELQIEGAGLPRLDIEEERDLTAADFRFGIPLVWARGNYEMKTAYYHLSSHIGDEYLVKNPGFQRVNYSRDVFVWGHSYYITDWLRMYGEAGWAFVSDVSEPWEFQFGFDYFPPGPTDRYGAWFWAINGHLREEADFGGNVVVQAGRAWRGGGGGHMFRFGVEYYNGKTDQFALYQESEEKIGLGLWYDY